MPLVEHYRVLYEHEKDCNHKMLAMLDSVPEASRSDARFQQAVTLAGHLAACRENWLEHIDRTSQNLVAWWDPACALTTLRPRFAALEGQWTAYLQRLDDSRLSQDFELIEEGQSFHLPTEVQVEQLVGHAAYHRGQIALLVDQLGGETVDTDYVYWAIPGSN